MANIKSAKKRIITQEKKRMRNKAQKSSMRTTMKNLDKLIVEGNKEEALKTLNLVVQKLDKAVSKGIVHKNYASRNKSNFMTKINKI
ncbi:MAG: 30S ribosomal protein S20 [Mycoplasmatales bacterium]